MPRVWLAIPACATQCVHRLQPGALPQLPQSVQGRDGRRAGGALYYFVLGVRGFHLLAGGCAGSFSVDLVGIRWMSFARSEYAGRILPEACGEAKLHLLSAGVAELVDAVDSKSTGGNPLPVRVRPPAPTCVSSKRFVDRTRKSPCAYPFMT